MPGRNAGSPPGECCGEPGAAKARGKAATVTNEAQYRVAGEKCNIYAGGAKDVCPDRAKAQFGKS